MSQAKTPLKYAAAVNSTRWVLFNVLKSLGLPLITGTGGQTKFNRIRWNLPKVHWIDAACVGVVETIKLVTTKILKVKATGFGGRSRCQTDKFGYPIKHRPLRLIHGFCTGDIVCTDVDF